MPRCNHVKSKWHVPSDLAFTVHSTPAPLATPLPWEARCPTPLPPSRHPPRHAVTSPPLTNLRVFLQDDMVPCSLPGDKILFYSDKHLVRQYLESYYLNVSGWGHGMISPKARSALFAASNWGGWGQHVCGIGGLDLPVICRGLGPVWLIRSHQDLEGKPRHLRAARAVGTGEEGKLGGEAW